MAILALEPDPSRAATIRHIVCDIVHAELKLVASKNELLQALNANLPDLILLPALLSPADETSLLEHLSTLRNSGHVELLVTPFSFAPAEAQAPQKQRWWQRRKPAAAPKDGGCDQQAFAERVSWSLRHGPEEKRAHADKSAPSAMAAVEPAKVESGKIDAEGKTHVRTLASDRRAHLRFQADELQGLRDARIKHGPRVRLVDCSTGGALIESDVPLRPDSEFVLELAGETSDSVVPFRVVRCQVATGESRLLYRGACVFTQPLEMDNLLSPPAAGTTPPGVSDTGRLDVAIKTIVEQHVSCGETTELVTSLQKLSGSQPLNPASRAMDDLLAVVISALQDGDESAVTTALIEKQLHVALPGLTARFAAAPSSKISGDREAFYLHVPTAGGASARVLNVELPQGAILEDWQFRLLKAGAYLAALGQTPLEGEDARPAEGRDRRQHPRVHGRFDGRRLGAINTPVLIHDLSVAGCFVDSLHVEKEGRQLTLEVFFPEEGLMILKVEVVCSRPGFGFAVRFVDVSEKDLAGLTRVVAARMEPSTDSGGSADVIGEHQAMLRELVGRGTASEFAQSMTA